MTPEGRVKQRVKQLLKEYGAWHFLPVSGGLGTHGIPDVIACHRGYFIGIEAKAPGKKHNVTALQRLQGVGIMQAGGWWIVVADDEDIVVLRSILEDPCRAR